MPPKRSATKRQYSAVDSDSDAASSASEGTSRAAPKKRTAAKPAATKKATTTKGPTPVKQLEKMDGGLVSAFNLMLYVADASHADCEASVKMSGHAQSPATRQEELPTVPKRWTKADADVGVFKTGRPNKQQYGQMERQSLEWEKDRRDKKSERRETVNDWVAVALQDLEVERDYLEEYGVDKYFPKSIDRLKELMGSASSAAAVEGVAV